ncbi:MAG TPA: fumarylacetoacetate hydrolase family protein [Actinomycetota bacterium]|nr:fumarylacetoacetate hydrolase family protein [Actinomycetota bacterium]
MTGALFRVRLSDGSARWAAGDAGPERLLTQGASLERLLGEGADLAAAIEAAGGPVPPDARVIAPIRSQEVWAAGVTYLRSREARGEEALDRSPYDLVYDADRPELFFKSPGWRVVGPGEPIGIRADSTWDVPEPELVLVLDAGLRVVAYAIGDDVSSRSLEGENPLYLPQAKTYERSCAIGPALVPANHVSPPFAIRLAVERDGRTAFAGETSTAEMKRSFEDLAEHLGRALTFPDGVFLFTGTGIVPDASFTLHPDDVVRVEIDGLGVLENPVVRVGR